MYLEDAGSDCEAGKSDKTRYTTYSNSNEQADDNLLHDIPFLSRDRPKASTAPLIFVVTNLTFLLRSRKCISYRGLKLISEMPFTFLVWSF